MSFDEFTGLLADPAQAGVYFVDARDITALIQAATTLDYARLCVDLAGCPDKAGLMERFATAGRFPDWFGGNWDALADTLADLSWWPAPGYVLLIEHGGDWRDSHADDFAVLLDILDDTARRWAGAGIGFWALLPLPAEQLARLED